jgi:hypothetical protein
VIGDRLKKLGSDVLPADATVCMSTLFSGRRPVELRRLAAVVLLGEALGVHLVNEEPVPGIATPLKLETVDGLSSDFQWRSVRYLDVHKADDPTLR